MIELRPVLLVPALYGAPAVGYASVRRRDPLHRARVEREEIEAAVVLALAAAVGHPARGDEARYDLAGMHRVGEEGGAEVDGRAVCVGADGRAKLLRGRQVFLAVEGDAEAGGRRGLWQWVRGRDGCLWSGELHLAALLVRDGIYGAR